MGDGSKKVDDDRNPHNGSIHVVERRTVSSAPPEMQEAHRSTSRMISIPAASAALQDKTQGLLQQATRQAVN
jgi:hypothetical protein